MDQVQLTMQKYNLLYFMPFLKLFKNKTKIQSQLNQNLVTNEKSGVPRKYD